MYKLHLCISQVAYIAINYYMYPYLYHRKLKRLFMKVQKSLFTLFVMFWIKSQNVNSSLLCYLCVSSFSSSLAGYYLHTHIPTPTHQQSGPTIFFFTDNHVPTNTDILLSKRRLLCLVVTVNFLIMGPCLTHLIQNCTHRYRGEIPHSLYCPV